MADHKSSVKRARQTTRRNNHNKARLSELKTVLKNVRTALAAKDKEAAKKLAPKVQSLLAKLGQKRTVNPKSSGRKIGRMMSQVAKLNA